MKRIYKYNLTSPGNTTLLMPTGAQVLKVAEQHGSICLWAMVDPGASEQERLFTMIGTGWDLEDEFADKLEYIDTYMSGPFVWHVFEIVADKDHREGGD